MNNLILLKCKAQEKKNIVDKILPIKEHNIFFSTDHVRVRECSGHWGFLGNKADKFAIFMELIFQLEIISKVKRLYNALETNAIEKK